MMNMREVTTDELEMISGGGDIGLDTIGISSTRNSTGRNSNTGDGRSNSGGTGEESVRYGNITITKYLYNGNIQFDIIQEDKLIQSVTDERTLSQKLFEEFGMRWNGMKGLRSGSGR